MTIAFAELCTRPFQLTSLKGLSLFPLCSILFTLDSSNNSSASRWAATARPFLTLQNFALNSPLLVALPSLGLRSFSQTWPLFSGVFYKALPLLGGGCLLYSTHPCRGFSTLAASLLPSNAPSCSKLSLHRFSSLGPSFCSQFQGPKGRRSKAFLFKACFYLRTGPLLPSGKGAFELTRANGTKIHIAKLPFGKGSKYRRPQSCSKFQPFL